MKKSSLVSKKILVTLLLGSMLYVPVAFAADYTIETDTTINDPTTYDKQDNVYIKDATLTLDVGALANNFSVKFNILKANGASTSTLVVQNGHFWLGDLGDDYYDAQGKEQYGTLETLNVDKVVVGTNSHLCFDLYNLNVGNNLKEVVINSVAPLGETAYYYGVLLDGPVQEYEGQTCSFGANITGDGTFFVVADLIFDSSKTGGEYNNKISSVVDILYNHINDPGDHCYDVKFDSSLTINADQLIGSKDIRNAGNLILTGGTLTRNVVAGTYRHYDYTKPEGEKGWYTEQSGEVYVIGGSLTVAENVKVEQTIYGGRDGSNNTLNLILQEGSEVNTVIGGIADAWTIDKNANNNNVTISGSGKVTVHYTSGDDGGGCVNGGLSETGDANYNKVTLNGSVVYDSDILGGAAGPNGKANENVVTINGGSFKDRIVAGSSEIQANKNKINITGGVFDICSNGEELNDIIAADEQVSSSSTASFTENSVVISGGSFSNTGAKEQRIMGAFATNGTLSKNSVNITGGTFNVPASGGSLEIYGAGSTNGTVTENKVEISNVTIPVNCIFGGYSENGDASKNEVNISGSGTIGTDEIADIVGGASENGKATENKVNIISTETLTVKADINGGGTDDGGGIAEKNIVTISGNNIAINGKVKGADTDTGFTNNNEVHLTGVTVHNKIVGGDSGGDEANYNKVVIDGGTYDETSNPGADDNGIIGGETKKDAKGNNVEIKNASVAIHIYGGFNEEGTTGTISGNSVVIKNTSIAADYNVYGGYAGNGASVSANTVELDNVTFAGNNKVYASGKNGVSTISATDGTITVGANGLVVNGALELGANSIVLNGNITGTGSMTIKAITSTNNAEITQASLTNESEFTSSLDNIHVTTFTNNGTLNTSGTLRDIAGSGTTILNGDASVNTDVNIAGTLNLNGKTIDMQDGAFKTLTVGFLNGTGNVKMDVDLSSSSFDKLAVTDPSGLSITLTSLNITADSAGTSGTLTDMFTTISSVNLAEEVATKYTSNYKYTFTQSGGSLSYTRVDSTKGLSDFINGEIGDLSITQDTVVDSDNPIGTVPNNKNINLPLNGYDLTAHSDKTTNGITVAGGGNMTVVGNDADLSKINKFDNAFVNNGVLNVQGVEFSGNNVAVANNNVMNVSGVTKIEDKVTGNGIMNVTDGTTTLTGSNAQVSNTMNVASAATVKVESGAGVTGMVNNQGTYELDASVGNAVNNSGTFEIKNNNVYTGALNNNGITKVNKPENLGAAAINNGVIEVAGGGTLEHGINGSGKVVVKDATTIKGAAVQQGILEIDSTAGTKKILIGDSTGKGVASVDTTKLNGGLLFLDPAWVSGVGIEGASNYATNTTNLDGQYVAGQNSVLSFGTTDGNDVVNYVKRSNSNVTWGSSDITAAVYLAKTVDLTSGAIYVDGSLTSAPSSPSNGTLTVKDNGLLMVNARNLTGDTAVTGVTTADISNNATIYLRGARTGQDLYITDGGASGLTPADLTLAGLGANFDAEASLDGAKLKIHIIKGSLAILEETVIPNVGEGMELSSGGTVSDFLDNVANYTDDTAAIGAINAVANLGELAGVNHGLYTVSNQMTDAVANHLSIIDNEEASHEVWATYIHNKEDMDGMKLGGIEAKYDAKYNGVVVGADLVKSDKGTAGVALTYVDGDVSGTSSGVHTKNDAKYYGASLYGRIGNSNMALLGDISYMHSKGDITQYNSGVDITAKPKSDAFSVGVRAEWAVKIGENAKLMPFAGLRYMRLGTGDYENNLGMKYDVDNQNLFMAPVGLAYSGNFEMGNKDWHFKPIVEFGYTFNMGDKDTDQKVSYNGYEDTFGMDIVDSGYWFGRIGFGFSNERTEWILGYQYMKSENTRNNKYMVHFNYKF